jgi:hypothetical protein
MKGWRQEHVYYLPTPEDFAELASLAGDRGLLMNPPDQWAEPPDGGPILSPEEIAREKEAAIARREAARQGAITRARRKARLEARRQSQRVPTSEPRDYDHWARPLKSLAWRAQDAVAPHADDAVVDPDEEEVAGTLVVWKTGWSWTRAK